MELKPDKINDGRYKILSHLGMGGMGSVWKALGIRHDDDVVIKIPQNHLDADIRKRFGREAKAMRKHSLECLNIEDVGMIGDVPWYAMRYLPGGFVRDRVLPRDEDGTIREALIRSKGWGGAAETAVSATGIAASLAGWRAELFAALATESQKPQKKVERLPSLTYRFAMIMSGKWK